MPEGGFSSLSRPVSKFRARPGPGPTVVPEIDVRDWTSSRRGLGRNWRSGKKGPFVTRTIADQLAKRYEPRSSFRPLLRPCRHGMIIFILYTDIVMSVAFPFFILIPVLLLTPACLTVVSDCRVAFDLEPGLVLGPTLDSVFGAAPHSDSGHALDSNSIPALDFGPFKSLFSILFLIPLVISIPLLVRIPMKTGEC
ncbi:hypothetical protein EVAR_97154_1 [Eumeta japonica]|uniref:Uncharacterized protein n=1 Tax=Eumeta variegata TaxID=151549 RepID=A0A4C1XT22_EUMVA|nr:hypothetical protein EVAR_97154_1 [Eumeta japonica]